MSNVTDKQLDYILRLANQLTGERARYLSQSSAVSEPKTSAEASALIDDLREALEAEEKRRADTGVIEGAKIRCAFTRKDGARERLAGTVTGLHWSGMQPDGLYLSDVEASWEVKSSWLLLSRMSEIVVGDNDLEALKAERARLLARVAEIDAILAADA